MPIYEYRCSECGFQKEFLQKVSDPVLTQCPECGKATFNKMVTAAGFQLKGTGWYVTDFRNGSAPASKKSDDAKTADTGTSTSDTKTDAGSDTKSESKTESKASSAAAPAPAPAAKSDGGSSGA